MPAILMSVLSFFLRAFLPAILEAGRDTSESSQRQPELKARLRHRIAAKWGAAPLAVVVCAAAATLGGCFVRTVYVPDTEPVRLRQDIPGAKVWAMDGKGKPIASVKDLKEGTWVLSDEPDEENPVPAEKVPFSEVK